MSIIISKWQSECPECPWCPGDVTGDGLVNLDDLLEVIGNWGAIYDPCNFRPEICAELLPPPAGLMGGGASMMSGAMSGQPTTPFQNVLEQWGFENWDEAAEWMAGASGADVAIFLLALSSAGD